MTIVKMVDIDAKHEEFRPKNIVNSVALEYEARGEKPTNSRRETSNNIGKCKSIDYTRKTLIDNSYDFNCSEHNFINELLVATSNKNKIKELTSILEPYNLIIQSIESFPNLLPPEEGAPTFVENANIKANYYGLATNLITIADDSGLSIDELNGFPGVSSARFAEEQGGFPRAIDKIQSLLKSQNKTSSKAKFVCALALRFPNGDIQNFIGEITGSLTFPPRGSQGFGYDPIFIPDNHTQTFAEMTSTEKNILSHRKQAVSLLTEFLLNNNLLK